MSIAPPVLMVVTDPSVPDLMARAADALAGGATWIQYRDKAVKTEQRIAWVRAFKERHPRVVIVVNGDEEAALKAGADGVHWPGRERPGRGALRATPSSGREDAEACPRPKDGVAEGPSAGSFTARPWLAGCSLHASDLPDADVSGLNYAVFGTVYASGSHPGGPVAGPEMLEQACRLPLPVLAIGGITAENAGDCIRAGAAGVAVIRSVLMAKDPARAASEILRAMREAKE